jgi:HSP20 family protein
MTDRETRSLAKWDPFSELSLLAVPFGRDRDMLERFWGRSEGGRALPAVDIAEDEGHYIVTAELPGTRKEDVTVEVHEGEMTIRGEKRNEREEKDEQRRYVERTYGSFSRSFTLPSNADPEKIKAQFDDGVLTVSIEKAAESKPRTVAIKS